MSVWSYRVGCLLSLLTACSIETEGNSTEHLLPDNVAADGGDARDGGMRADANADASVSKDASDILADAAACATAAVAAEQVVVQEEVEVQYTVEVPSPVALYVMFDRSASMGTSGLWTPAVNALKSFVQSDASSGMDVALQYFPASGYCDGSGYSTPAVGLGRLPEHAPDILNSLSGQSGTGFGTPIEGALRGVTSYCRTFQASHADERCIAVLVTDGKPEFDGCEHDNDNLAAIASSAWLEAGVRTFAVGLSGADFTLLDKIAMAGGATDCDPGSRYACDVSSGAEKLETALATIREKVKTTQTRTETRTETRDRPLECTWRMPDPPPDQTLDKNRVNVLVSGGSNAPLDLGHVPDASSCGDRAGAWYFDSASNPTQILACPKTCEAITGGGYTSVNILLGCETKEIIVI